MTQLVLSLFPGIDMLGMAFDEEGFSVVAGPDVVWGRDIRTFHPPAGKFDGIIGGPPCQTFSALANLVRAKGLEPSFGNLIPEFVRCVAEARPAWWLMENVRGVPEDCWPRPDGYGMHTFELDNAWLDSGDGFGEEQSRKRRFWFGTRDREAPDLRKRIRLAALELPKGDCVIEGTVQRSPVLAGNDAAPGQRSKTSEVLRQRASVTQNGVNNSAEAKGRVQRPALTHRPESVPVAPRRSGKLKRTAVTGAHTCSHRPKNGHGNRYTLADMLRLQGMPADALKYAPFTVTGMRKLIGNGVPMSMGRALARAVREATK